MSKLTDKLRKKKKWELKQEYSMLVYQQKKLRLACDKLDEAEENFKDRMIEELQKEEPDAAEIAKIDQKMKDIKEVRERFEKKYKRNSEVLKTYRETLKLGNDCQNNGWRTASMWVTGLGGLGLGYLGLKKAYEYDVDGESPLLVIRSKTKEAFGKLPIFKNNGGNNNVL